MQVPIQFVHVRRTEKDKKSIVCWVFSKFITCGFIILHLVITEVVVSMQGYKNSPFVLRNA